jgi:hypothetical protein
MIAGHGQCPAPALHVAATTTGSTPQSLTLVTRAVETTNEDVSYPANVDQSEHGHFRFHPPDSRDPWNLLPMWPVTHRQRIAELKFLATFYNKRGQEQNLQAAINWHSEFPPDEFCGYESACFQGGVIKDEAELNLEDEDWYEVSYNSYSL